MTRARDTADLLTFAPTAQGAETVVPTPLIINGDINQYGLLLQDHWQEKLKRSPEMCPDEIKNYIKIGLDNGALGAKLIGAGGGGFLLFVCNEKHQLRRKFNELGLRELTFRFDFLGAQILDT